MLTQKITIFLIIGILMSISSNITAQSTSHDDEILKADALALAQVNCDHSLTYYYYKLDPENKTLTAEVRELTRLNKQMSLNLMGKYSKSDDDKKKFEREISSAKKKLSKCIKYQNILDANAELEKQKAKKSK